MITLLVQVISFPKKPRAEIHSRCGTALFHHAQGAVTKLSEYHYIYCPSEFMP